MQEIIENILSKVELENEEKLRIHLERSLRISTDTFKSTYATEDNIVFKVEVFFKTLQNVLTEFKADVRTTFGVNLLSLIFEELGMEIEPAECFILHHIRNLGKFRVRQDNLYKELQVEWKTFKGFEIEESDFSYTLKNLMRADLIEYRRKNILINKQIIIRFKPES